MQLVCSFPKFPGRHIQKPRTGLSFTAMATIFLVTTSDRFSPGNALSMFKTIIFFLPPTSTIRQLDQHDYARLVRGESTDLQYAGQTVRVADWYVKVGNGLPVAIENETYSLLSFDSSGRVLRPNTDEEAAVAYCPQGGEMETFKEQENMRGSNVEQPWLPTRQEREQMLKRVCPMTDKEAGQ